MAKWAEKMADYSPESAAPPVQPEPAAPKQPGKWAQKMESFAGTEPLGSVFTDVTDQPEPAGFGTELKAAFLDKPEALINLYSSARGIPPDRYGIQNGEVVYQADDGTLKPETPWTWFGQFKKGLAKGTTQLPGEAFTILTTYLGGLPGATLGGAVVEQIKKTGGRLLGEKQTIQENIRDTAFTAGSALVGERAGDLIPYATKKLEGRKLGQLSKAAGSDIDQIDPADVARVQKLFNKWNIEGYAPQVTGSKKLRDKWTLLRDLPETSDKVYAADLRQAKQVDVAINKYLKQYGPDWTPDYAGEKISEAAGTAIEKGVKTRAARTEPIYYDAFGHPKSHDIDTSKILERIDYIIENAPPGSSTEKAMLRINKMLHRQKFNKQTSLRLAEKLGDDVTTHLEGQLDLVRRSEPGRRIALEASGQGGTPDIIGLKSGYPDWMSGKKWTKQEVTGALRKGLAGKDMGDKQEKIWEAALQNARESFGQELEDWTGQNVDDQITEYITKRASKVKVGEIPEHRLRTLNSVKKEIDFMLEGPDAANIQKETKFEIQQIKKQLVDEMKGKVPTYGEALEMHASLSPGVEKLEKGLVGSVAKVTGDKSHTAARKLLTSMEVSVENLKRAREAIQPENPEAWDAVIKTYLQDVFKSIKTGAATDITNKAGWFYKKTLGDPVQRDLLEEAMGDKFPVFEEFGDVLNKVSFTYRKEAISAARAEALKAMDKEGASVIGSALKVDLTRPAYQIGEWINTISIGKNRDLLVKALTSRDAIKKLKAIKGMDPKSAKYANAFMAFVGLKTGSTLRLKATKEKNVPIGTFPKQKGETK